MREGYVIRVEETKRRERQKLGSDGGEKVVQEGRGR